MLNFGFVGMANCTLAGNSASDGGGIFNYSGTATLINCTLAGNSATFAGGGINTSGTLALANTIVAGNSAGLAVFRDIGGGYSGSHNLVGGDPLLGPLQDNGGPTLTMALLAGSPAIDAGGTALVPAGLTTDQRGTGFARVARGAVDIGAFEVQNQAPTALALSAATVAENRPAGTAVGALGATVPDAGKAFTYTLVSGPGGDANDLFEIVGNQLRARQSFDFEAGSPYTVRVRVTDAGGSWTEQAFVIHVENVPERNGTLSGNVVFDANRNGVADAGEAGVAGQVVFADANGNGALDEGEASAATDARGRYVLGGLLEGQAYTVRLFARSDFAPAGATSVDVAASRGGAGPTFTGVRFLNSAPIFLAPEATATDPDGSNRAFVQGLYHDLLGRDGEAAGVDGWVGLLTGGSRADVVRGIFNSEEHRGRQVDHFYQAFLGRDADEAGRAAWIDYLQHGGTEEGMTVGFLTSAEYQAKFAGNAAFVESLYDKLLGRAASQFEVAFWENVLNAGTSREDVVRLGFLDSKEASLRALDGFYAAFLRRDVDPTGQAGSGEYLQRADGNAINVMLSVLDSEEYWGRSAT